MLKLISNEWTKLWSKKATWIMLILTVLFVFTLFVGDKLLTSNNDYWIEDEKNIIVENQKLIDSGNSSKEQISDSKEKIAISQYRLDQNMSPYSMNGSDFIASGSSLMMFVSLFATIVAAGIVSFEFGNGTIKMLLTRPINRWKILLSKLITTFIFAFLLGAIIYILSLLIAVIFYGSSNPELEYVNGAVVEVSKLSFAFSTYAYNYVGITMSILLAFMLGTVFNSSSLAIGLTLFISFMSKTFVHLLSQYEFIKYFWFSVTDLQGIKNGASMIPDLTISFAVVILVVYAVLFIAISFFKFTKQDIKA